MPQEFWINKHYIPAPVPPSADACVKILIPDSCPHCGDPIKVDPGYPGDNRTETAMLTTCPHTKTYTAYWNIQIQPSTPPASIKQDKTSTGMRCSRCKDFNPYGEPNQADGSFLCFSCRQH